MKLPFSTEQFLEVFRNYNLAVWPAQIVLWLLAVMVIILAVKPQAFSGKYISGLLAFFWLWMGIVYHLMHFTEINKGAYLFGGLFIVQGILFWMVGVWQNKLAFRFQPNVYGLTGAVLLLYALLIYPVLGYALGHIYPTSPTFGLPCPTTIFTFGILLWADKKLPFFLLIIPLLWSVIGFMAAVSLGIKEDIGLLIAGLLAGFLIFRHNKTFAKTENIAS